MEKAGYHGQCTHKYLQIISNTVLSIKTSVNEDRNVNKYLPEPRKMAKVNLWIF